MPLLDHMMDLANQTIEQQKNLPSSNFLVGFKMDAFMNRLNMHVISNDFCSDTMRRIQHWNTFNSDLFITHQAVYALLKFKGSIEPLSPDTAEKLRTKSPVHCNQCTFITLNFNKFKDHLQIHWLRAEKRRLYERNISQLRQSFGNMNMNGNFKNYKNLQNVDHRPQNQMVGNKQQERRELHVNNNKACKKEGNKNKQNP